MHVDHAADFEAVLTGVLSIYNRERPTPAAARAWWAALEPFDWCHVCAALNEHAARSKFPPTPADIIARLEACDGRPSAAEAWALALAADDEAETVVWTPEIAEARSAAKPALDIGDKVGARQAFVDAYERRVAEARRELRPASWQVSLGHDPARRRLALDEAMRRRRLPGHTVAALCPQTAESASQNRLEPTAVSGLLAGNVAEFLVDGEHNRRRFRAAIDEGLRIADAGKAANKRKRDEQRARKTEEDAARRAEWRRELEHRQQEGNACRFPDSLPPEKTAKRG